ncbi:MAG: type II secretion system protein N, partial [Mariprofundaceae bacterium]
MSLSVNPSIRLPWMKIPRLVELLLILTMVWMGVNWFQPESGTSEMHHGGLETKSHGNLNIGIDPIIAAAPFGVAKNESEASQPVKPPPPPVLVSKLNLKLKGTVIAPEKSAAFVISKTSAGQDVFFVGENLLPGVKLANVASTYILIDVHGKREKVRLDEGMTS